MPFRTQLTKDKAHEDSIWTTAWTDKNQILSGSVDETVKVWDVTADAASAAAEDEGLTQLALKQARKLTGHNLGAHSLDVSAANGQALALPSDTAGCPPPPLVPPALPPPLPPHEVVSDTGS